METWQSMTRSERWRRLAELLLEKSENLVLAPGVDDTEVAALRGTYQALKEIDAREDAVQKKQEQEAAVASAERMLARRRR